MSGLLSSPLAANFEACLIFLFKRWARQGLCSRLETPEYNKKGIIYSIVLTQNSFFLYRSVYLSR